MEKNQTAAAAWVAAAGRRAGHELTLGEDGHCLIAFGENLQCMVEVPAGSELLFLYVPLVRLPESEADQLRLLKSALHLNMFGIQTGGGTLGYDERTGYLVLTFSARLEMLDEDLFGKVLGDLLDVALQLHPKLLSGPQDGGTAADENLPPFHLRV